MNIAEAAKALEEAQREHKSASTSADAAGRILSTALNALNEAQKAFDLTVSEQKKNPPWNSRWHNHNKGQSA